jgi:hypothetical protein
MNLLATIPRSLGTTVTPASTAAAAYLPPNNRNISGNVGVNSIDRNTAARRLSVTAMTTGDDGDIFLINFTQFYELLLRITQIVYAELWEEDKTVALNKVLQEVILPMYVWSQGHSKLGSTDQLMREERISLLLHTYAPNLWRVFLMYAQDSNGKVPEFNLQYPQCAQDVERLLFGVPKGSPAGFVSRQASAGVEPYMMTLAACVRLCLDYGLVPHLATREDVKKIYCSVYGQKQVSLRKGPVVPSSTNAVKARYAMKPNMYVH